MFSSLIKVFDPFPPLKTLSMFVLWMCFTSFGFFVGYFYSSMIKTDAVTVKAPDVAMSYQDVLDMNLSVLLDGSLDAYVSFKNADPNSIKGRIWKKNEELLSIKSDIIKLEAQITSTKTVVIGHSKQMNVAKYVGYARIKPMKDLRVMLTTDQSEEPKVRVLAVNSFLDPKHIKLLHRRISHVFQANLVELVLDLEMSRYIMFLYSYSVTGQVNENFADFDDYVSSKIHLGQPQIFTPDMSYFYGLFYVVSLCLGLSLLSLVIEVLYNKYFK